MRLSRGSWIFLLSVVIAQSPGYEKLKTIYSWKSLEFAYPNEHSKHQAISNGDFIPGQPLPIDVDVYTGGSNGQKAKVFVSIPRFQDGVPVTLGYVTEHVSPAGNPLVAPFPNWEFNRLGNCDHITSVYRMKIDECNRLWVLDTGKLKTKQVCPAQIHLFSLETNRLIGQYKFPHDLLKEDSLFVTIAVDVRDPHGRCEDTFAYIADVTGFQLIVYDHRNHDSWSIHNNLFYPYPPDGTFEINGESFDLMDGILGLALSPPLPNGDKILYFHSLASRVESYVPTSVIRNGHIFKENPEASPRSFVSFPMPRTSQSAAQAIDRNGVLFFGLLSDVAMACWNSRQYPTYGGTNNEIVVVNPQTLQFPSGVKVITAKNGKQELWVITPSFQKYMTGSLNPNETNFRIQAGFIDEIVRGTKCDVSLLNTGWSHSRATATANTNKVTVST